MLVPPEAAGEALDLLLDLVLHPRLDPDAFAMERQVVLEELAQCEDQPEEVAVQRLLHLACPQHPYGEAILGRREQLLRHTPESMAGFRQRLYGPGRCLLSLSGALQAAGLAGDALDERLAGGALGALQAGASPPAPDGWCSSPACTASPSPAWRPPGC